MTKATRYARTSALPAIAAALALSSTPVFAQQQTPPVTTEPATTVPAPADQAAPTTVPADPAPAADAASTAPQSQATSSDVATPAATSKAHAAKAKPATTAARRAPRPVEHPVTRPAHSAPATIPAPAAALPAPAMTAPPAPAPAASATPAPAPVAKPLARGNDSALEIGGGLLALLALGGGAFAISRRRRDEVDEEWHDGDASIEEAPEAVTSEAAPRAPSEPELVADQPAILAPPASAFAWGSRPAAPVERKEMVSDDERRPGETWVERAYRGPSPNNPSLSLRKRLKRAAFFDKRERAAAEGRAAPVAADAGLPANAMANDEELVAA